MKQTPDILFDYLKDILYHPAEAHLDLNELPEDFQKLGQGMQFLAACVQEERAFLRALAKGDLSFDPPSVENVLAAPAKGLQGTLRHLTWQTKQIANGDYSQRVDFMGEFSESFNTMTEQLQERNARLLAKRKMIEEKNLELMHNLNLVLALANYTHNLIFVFSEATGQRIFTNQPAENFLAKNPHCAETLQTRLAKQKVDAVIGSENWELPLETESGTVFYDIESFRIVQNEEFSIVHIVIDATVRKNRENLFYNLAYIDPLTTLYNRRYAMELMERWIHSGTPFLLSYVDVDYLKYCNDTFGHEAGDQYLISVTNTLKAMDCDVCRIGGDEFLILQIGNDNVMQDLRLSHLRNLIMQKDAPYPQSFSFATTAVPSHPVDSLEKYMRETDQKMYLYKQTHKQKL